MAVMLQDYRGLHFEHYHTTFRHSRPCLVLTYRHCIALHRSFHRPLTLPLSDNTYNRLSLPYSYYHQHIISTIRGCLNLIGSFLCRTHCSGLTASVYVIYISRLLNKLPSVRSSVPLVNYLKCNMTSTALTTTSSFMFYSRLSRIGLVPRYNNS